MLPIIARNLFHLQERLLGRHTFAIAKELEESQWWSSERIKDLQLERLRKLVSTAYQHTPYWRSIMDEHGILPGDIRSLDDLRRFPLLEKSTLRARLEEMVWKDEGPRLLLTRTSGSTNEALQFYSNSNREANINAARIRGHRWIGVNIGEKEGYFWGAPVELSTQDRVKQARDFLTNNLLTNAFEVTPNDVPKYLAEWKKWKPKCLFGYPNSFVLIADMAEQLGIDLSQLRAYGLKVISTTSEVLGEENRKIINNAFGVPVYDSYGLREGGFVGHECEHYTMHCTDEQSILETIDPKTLEPTKGEGELMLTNLVSHVMPIVRYRTGDMVTLSQKRCECGRSLSSISISGGRIADFIITNKGTWIVGYSFIYICRSVKGIVKFQVVQERLGEVNVLLVTDNEFPSDGRDQVSAAVRARLKSDDKITVEIVKYIAPSPSGKYRPVIGKVAEGLRSKQVYDVQS